MDFSKAPEDRFTRAPIKSLNCSSNLIEEVMKPLNRCVFLWRMLSRKTLLLNSQEEETESIADGLCLINTVFFSFSETKKAPCRGRCEISDMMILGHGTHRGRTFWLLSYLKEIFGFVCLGNRKGKAGQDKPVHKISKKK